MKPLHLCFCVFLIVSAGAAASAQDAYDPLALPASFKVNTVDLTVHDSSRQRGIPVRAYLPVSEAPAPVVLFSPGLGGSREGYRYLGEHWSARGYVCVVLQHPGSDDSVWRDVPPRERLRTMREAASPRNLVLRIEDVHCVLDFLENANRMDNHPLKNRMDLKHVGMAGHSFGAVTTEAIGGELFTREEIALGDSRIRAAIALSPSPARDTAMNAAAFGKVAIPWMLMTGTKDVAPIGDQSVESRLSVFPSLPPRDKYEVVLLDAEHSAFTDRALPGDKEERNPNHHLAILALSTAFWDTYLKDDEAARRWLTASGPSGILEKGDVWQTK